VKKKTKKKAKVVAWYLPKQDQIVEFEANTSYGLIIMLIQWNPMFDRDTFMLLGVV
jgi:hypothetical protein